MKYERLLIIILFLVISFSNLDAQQSKQEVTIDQLFNELKNAYSDSVDLVMPLSENMLAREDIKKDSSILMKIIKYQGLSHRKQGNYVKSITIFKEVYDYAKNHKKPLLQAEAGDQMGIMNTFMGNMLDGQKYLLEVAEIYKKVGTVQDQADANLGLAILYNDLNQQDKAIELYNLTLLQYEELNDTMGRANVHANLGLLYTNRKEYELAEENLKMQGYLDTLLDTQWGLGFYHDFMGLLRNEQSRHDEALTYFHTALRIRENLDSHYNLAETRAGLSETHMLLGNYDQAIHEAELILEFKEDHQSLSQQMTADELLSKIYEKKNDYKKALTYHKAYKEMSDSIYKRDMLYEITNKDALYQKAIQDEHIATLNAENIISQTKLNAKNKIITLGGIALVTISILIFFLFRLFKKISLQKDLLQDAVIEKDLLLREIHHRVKNNLQLVSSLLTLQGRSISDATAIQAINEGKSRVRSMALIHQNLYNHENLANVSVNQYLDKLIQELFTTYKINEEKVNLTKSIEDINLDIDTLVPLGLVINELISNSLKYAFVKNTKGELKISIKKVKEKIRLIVEDNGIGYDTNAVNDSSFGSILIHALTDQLDGTIDIHSHPGKTRTEILF